MRRKCGGELEKDGIGADKNFGSGRAGIVMGKFTALGIGIDIPALALAGKGDNKNDFRSSNEIVGTEMYSGLEHRELNIPGGFRGPGGFGDVGIKWHRKLSK